MSFAARTTEAEGADVNEHAHVKSDPVLVKKVCRYNLYILVLCLCLCVSAGLSCTQHEAMGKALGLVFGDALEL
jgi:hypothetical protein